MITLTLTDNEMIGILIMLAGGFIGYLGLGSRCQNTDPLVYIGGIGVIIGFCVFAAGAIT